jgi:formate-dependent nitrite reductase membrane component NrfD
LHPNQPHPVIPILCLSCCTPTSLNSKSITSLISNATNGTSAKSIYLFFYHATILAASFSTFSLSWRTLLMGDEEGKRSSRYATAQKAQISEKMGVLYACRFPRKTVEWSFRAARAGGTMKRKKLES